MTCCTPFPLPLLSLLPPLLPFLLLDMSYEPIMPSQKRDKIAETKHSGFDENLYFLNNDLNQLNDLNQQSVVSNFHSMDHISYNS